MPQLDPTVESATGQPRGVSGAAENLEETNGVPDPIEITKAAVASFPSSVTSSLERRYSDRADASGGWAGELLAYQLVTPISEAARDQAIALIAPAMIPIDRKSLGFELLRLRTACKALAQPDQDLRLWLELIAEECARYPRDVVVWGLRQWVEEETFTPAVAELRQELTRIAAPRFSLFDALRSAETSEQLHPAMRTIAAEIGQSQFKIFERVDVDERDDEVILGFTTRFKRDFARSSHAPVVERHFRKRVSFELKV